MFQINIFSSLPPSALARPLNPNIYSLGTCEVLDCQLPCSSSPSYWHLCTMKGSYKSPSKQKRDRIRLLQHLFKSLKKNKSLCLSEPNLKPILTKSAFTSTNFPEPCFVCHEHQCNYNFNREVYFTVKAACEEQLLLMSKKKPPDGGG